MGQINPKTTGELKINEKKTFQSKPEKWNEQNKMAKKKNRVKNNNIKTD